MNNSSVNKRAPLAMRKYLFDVSFEKVEEPKEIIEVSAPPPPPTFSEEELGNAVANALVQGVEQGKQEALESIEQKILSFLVEMKNNLEGLIEQETQKRMDFIGSAIGVGKKITEKILPITAKKNALTEVEGIIRRALGQLMKPVAMSIQVHPDLVAQLEPRLDPLQPNKKFMILKANPHLSITDVKLTWADGGLNHVSTEIWNKIDLIVNEYFTPPVLEKNVVPSDTKIDEKISNQQSINEVRKNSHENIHIPLRKGEEIRTNTTSTQVHTSQDAEPNLDGLTNILKDIAQDVQERQDGEKKASNETKLDNTGLGSNPNSVNPHQQNEPMTNTAQQPDKEV